MDDDKIVELFWQRAESAIRETEKKYARYIKYIAYRILGNHEDAEECENDVYLKARNSFNNRIQHAIKNKKFYKGLSRVCF